MMHCYRYFLYKRFFNSAFGFDPDYSSLNACSNLFIFLLFWQNSLCN